jgi:hypothetical protein
LLPIQTELAINTNMILADTHTMVADTHTMVADTHTMVADTHTMVADIHRNVLTGRGTDDPVSAIFYTSWLG